MDFEISKNSFGLLKKVTTEAKQIFYFNSIQFLFFALNFFSLFIDFKLNRPCFGT
jgi:hypothetical protein